MVFFCIALTLATTKKVFEYYSIFAQVSQLEEKQNKLQETLAELEKKAEQVKAKSKKYN